MAPEISFNSYKRYKAGTREFTSWLVQTAQAVAPYDILSSIPTLEEPKDNNKGKRKVKSGESFAF